MASEERYFKLIRDTTVNLSGYDQDIYRESTKTWKAGSVFRGITNEHTITTTINDGYVDATIISSEAIEITEQEYDNSSQIVA